MTIPTFIVAAIIVLFGAVSLFLCLDNIRVRKANVMLKRDKNKLANALIQSTEEASNWYKRYIQEKRLTEIVSQQKTNYINFNVKRTECQDVHMQ